MYSTNRNIQIKSNHKLCKIKSRYIKLQYNVWQDFSLARFQLHVFLRLVKPTLKADLWEQSMSDVALKSIRFGYNVKKTTWVFMKDLINTNQMLFLQNWKIFFRGRGILDISFKNIRVSMGNFNFKCWYLEIMKIYV